MRKKLIVGALVALVVTLVLGGTVLAQGPVDGDGSGRAFSGDRLAKLAEKLEMAVEEVQAAIEAGTLKDLLAEKGIELPPGRKGKGGKREMSNERIANLAEELDMTVEEVEAAIEAGTLKDLLPEDMERSFGPDKPALTDEQIANLAEKLDMTVEEVEAAIEAGTLRDLLPEDMGRPFAPGKRELTDEQIANLAERLGLTVEEVEAAIEAGTLRDLFPEDVERPQAGSGKRPGGPRNRPQQETD